MTDDAEETHRPSHPVLFQLLRKIFMILAVFFVFYTYAMRGQFNAHPDPSLPRSPRDMAKPPQTAVATPDQPVKNVPAPVPAHTDPVSQNEEIARLQERVNQLEARLEKSEGTQAAKTSATGDEKAEPAAPAQVDNAEKERVTHLESLLSEQEKSLEDMKLQLAEVQAIKTQIGDIKAHGNRTLSALTAFGILKETIRSGEPFGAQLHQLYKMVPNNEHSDDIVELLDSIKPYADKGVMTISSLQSQFSDILPVALAPDRKNRSWKQNLQMLIRIRKEGEKQEGNDDEAILARAEAKVGHRDLNAALKEMESLSPPAAETLAPWTASAKAYVAAGTTIDALQLALVADSTDAKASSTESDKAAAHEPPSPPKATGND